MKIPSSERSAPPALFSALKPRSRGCSVPKLDSVVQYTLQGVAERTAEDGRSFKRVLWLAPLRFDAPCLPGSEVIRAEGEALVSAVHGASSLFNAIAEQGPFDLAAGVLPLHRCEHPPLLLALLRGLLVSEGGRLIVAFPGEETLTELRKSAAAAELSAGAGAGARVPPFIDVKTAGMLLQSAGFADPVSDVETVSAVFPDVVSFIRDLRALGETSPLAQKAPLPRGFLPALQQEYAARYAGALGGVRVRVDIVTLAAWVRGKVNAAGRGCASA